MEYNQLAGHNSKFNNKHSYYKFYKDITLTDASNYFILDAATGYVVFDGNVKLPVKSTPYNILYTSCVPDNMIRVESPITKYCPPVTDRLLSLNKPNISLFIFILLWIVISIPVLHMIAFVFNCVVIVLDALFTACVSKAVTRVSITSTISSVAYGSKFIVSCVVALDINLLWLNDIVYLYVMKYSEVLKLAKESYKK